jgi:hypothetical protein
MHRNVKDITGQRFGRLIVLSPIYSNRRGVVWVCQCDCGNQTEVLGVELRRGNIQSCGCLRKDSARIRLSLKQYQASKNDLYYRYKREAKNRNLSFDLSLDQFTKLINQNCYYCGIQPKQSMKSVGFNGIILYNGIDRVDNIKGYTFDNCVTCCKHCNTAKMAMSLNEFREWVGRIYENLKSSNWRTILTKL